MAIQTKLQIKKQLEEAAKRVGQVNRVASGQRASLLPDSGLDPVAPVTVTNTSLAGNSGNDRRD